MLVSIRINTELVHRILHVEEFFGEVSSLDYHVSLGLYRLKDYKKAFFNEYTYIVDTTLISENNRTQFGLLLVKTAKDYAVHIRDSKIDSIIC